MSLRKCPCGDALAGMMPLRGCPCGDASAERSYGCLCGEADANSVTRCLYCCLAVRRRLVFAYVPIVRIVPFVRPPQISCSRGRVRIRGSVVSSGGFRKRAGPLPL
jgi:hypothetical protein